MTDVMGRVTRRGAMGLLGTLGIGAIGTAVAPGVKIEGGIASAAADAGHAHEGALMPQAAPAAQSDDEPTADEMDAMHEAGVKAFPAATKGLGGQPLEFTMEGDVKVFDLVCQVVQWEVTPGTLVEAWTYNGVTPGPEIRVTEGDKVRINVTNELPQSTAVHWHGLMVPNSQDGVPFITQPPIKPGQSFTYEFPIKEGNAGAHMYHSHHNAAFQVTKGLLGAFSLNGKGFPATQPLMAKKGEKILIRYMNEGLMIHPMHLHGMPMTVFAHDGYLVPQPYMCDTLNIAPGQRFETIVEATEPGIWAFHCHILNHAESEHGMFGMVTALIVEE